MATTPPAPDAESVDRPLLDQLVPPPWSGGRRLAAVAVTAVIVVAAATLWWLGVLGPNLAPVRGYSYGALEETVATTPTGARAGTVEVQLELFNRGQLLVHDLTLDGPPFGGASLRMPGGPIDIAPRREARVTFHLVIDDCARLQAAPRPWLSYSGTSGRASVHGRTLRIVGTEASDVTPTWFDAREPDVASWWYEIAQPVCDPDALHAP